MYYIILFTICQASVEHLTKLPSPYIIQHMNKEKRIEGVEPITINNWRDWEEGKKEFNWLKLKSEDRKTYKANNDIFEEGKQNMTLSEKAIWGQKHKFKKNTDKVNKRENNTPLKKQPKVMKRILTENKVHYKETVTRQQQDAILLKARDDFVVFALLVGHIISPSYKLYDLHKEIAFNLQRIEDEGLLGGVFSSAPRTGKTALIDIYIAWQIGKYPHLNHVVMTYGEKLSIKHMMQVRDILKSSSFKSVFPEVVIRRDADAKTEFVMKQGGIINGIGRGGGISGNTYHRIYLDDIVTGANEIRSADVRETLKDFMSNLVQRRISGTDIPQSEKTKVIVIGTRYFYDDPIGEIVELIETKWGGIVRNYPAIAFEDINSDITGELWKETGDLIVPERVDNGALETAKLKNTPENYKAIYLGIPMENTVNFKQEWIKYASEEDILKENPVNFLFIDLAVTTNTNSDDTGFAIGMLTRGGVVYVKAWGEKLEPKEVVEKLFELHDKYNFKLVGMEKMMGSQVLDTFIKDEMKRQNRLVRFELISHGNVAKETRILGALPALYSNGLFRHVKFENIKLEKQMMEYPNGQHDDVLDAVAGLSTITGGEKEKQRTLGKIVKTNLGTVQKWGY